MPHQAAALKSFQQLFDLSLDVICIVDLEGQFINVSAAALPILGYRPEELIGKKIFDLIYEEDKESTLQITFEALEKGKKVINYENRYVRKDGSLVDMEWSAIHSPEAQVGYCIGRDISERKLKERQIKDQHEKLEKAQEIAQLGYWEYNMQDNTGYWSDSLYTIFGVNKATYGEATIEKYAELVHPEDRSKMAENIELFRTHDKLEHVLRLVRPDGATIYVNNIYSIIKDKDGNILKLSGVSQDITEKVLLEKRLALEKEMLKRYVTRAVIDAQEKERSKIGRDLHDNVNQVLTTVKLYMELGLSNEFDTQELQRKSVQYIADCINEIRSISRSLSAPTLGGISFKDSIQELTKSISETNRLKVKLKITGITAKDPSLPTDLHLGIYRIIQEQLTNILKHAHAKHVTVTINKTAQAITLRIEDDGTGFDTRLKRTGIGITNMITRAEALNGQLHIESEPTKGTVLTCTFTL